MIKNFYRVLLMFDLPHKTKRDRRIASRFRNTLITEGFERLQYSLYTCRCYQLDCTKRLISRLEAKAPEKGDIRALVLTERQYLEMLTLQGEKIVNIFQNHGVIAL